MNLDIRDENFWYDAALKKELEEEKSQLYGRRLAQSSEYEPIRQRIEQINFMLQRLETPDSEPTAFDPEEGLPPLKDRKIKIKGEE